MHPHDEVVCNKIITGDLLGSSTDFNCVLDRKSDILIYDKQTMKIFIVEISVPFDTFVDKCYHTKCCFLNVARFYFSEEFLTILIVAFA